VLLVRCEDVALILPRAVDVGEPVDEAVQNHVNSCLTCQAELARYHKLLKALRTLRTQLVVPAPGTLAMTLAALPPGDPVDRERSARRLHRRHRWRRRGRRRSCRCRGAGPPEGAPPGRLSTAVEALTSPSGSSRPTTRCYPPLAPPSAS
jgi:hypothetical protein